MNAAEARDLPIGEKFQIMEAIWDDLRRTFEESDIPESHKTLLDERRARVKAGDASLLNWDEVKSSIGRG